MRRGADHLQNGTQPSFIDVFAGAGGLSLGLLQAGWQGLFAIEKSPMAFETLKHNLVDPPNGLRLAWPEWLPKASTDITEFLGAYADRLEALQGLPLLAGGPPCQGFSTSGRRKHDDDRNRLFEQYLELVDLLKPKLLLVENVPGFATAFTKTEKGNSGLVLDEEEEQFNANAELQCRLKDLGYESFIRHNLRAKNFGVPQWRPRYILLAVKTDFLAKNPTLNPFSILDALRDEFLRVRGLPVDNEVTVLEAISDLEQVHGTVQCPEPGMHMFKQGVYGPLQGTYQHLMRRDRNGRLIDEGKPADSHRFPNHTELITKRLQRILDECRSGILLSKAERERLGISKHTVIPLSENQACHTITSLPDDLVHYREPRIPTVREYARIQSFPDWFEFRARYTTGGKRRRVDIPRYTQAANAVPPLMAEALGLALLSVYRQLSQPPQEANTEEQLQAIMA